jgi:hypothetical protein
MKNIDQLTVAITLAAFTTVLAGLLLFSTAR